MRIRTAIGSSGALYSLSHLRDCHYPPLYLTPLFLLENCVPDLLRKCTRGYLDRGFAPHLLALSSTPGLNSQPHRSVIPCMSRICCCAFMGAVKCLLRSRFVRIHLERLESWHVASPNHTVHTRTHSIMQQQSMRHTKRMTSRYLIAGGYRVEACHSQGFVIHKASLRLLVACGC